MCIESSGQIRPTTETGPETVRNRGAPLSFKRGRGLTRKAEPIEFKENTEIYRNHEMEKSHGKR